MAAEGVPEAAAAPAGPRAPAWPVRVALLAERSSTLVVTALAILSALIVGAVIMIVTTPETLGAWGHVLSNPARALTTSWALIETAYAALFTGSAGDPAAYVHAFAVRTPGAFTNAFSPLSETLVATAPLLLCGLSVSLAFRAGLFNIGATSQLIAGAIVASWVGISLPGLPLAVHMPLALLAGCAGGAAAGWIPGVLRARTGAHEVIVTIMLNYVALNLIVYILSLPFFLGPQQVNSISRAPAGSALLPHLAGASLRVNAGILLALAAAWVVAWLLQRTTLGFRFRMAGASQDAARAAGVDVRRMITLAMVLAGGLAGLAGAVQVLGVDPQLVPAYGGESGFTAITVALLGRARPGGVVLAALLFGAFQAGGLQMQAATTVPLELVQVIEAVIVFFIAAPALVRAIYRIRTQGGGFRLFSQGWGG